MRSQPVATGHEPVSTMRSASWLARASAQNFAGLALPLVVALATVPFLVRELGPERFGIVALAWTLAGYFALFDLGLGRAVTKLGSEALADANAPQLHSLLRSALLVQVCFGGLAALVIALAAAPIASMLRVSPALFAEARDSFRIIAFAIPAILIANTYRGALEAAARFDIVNVLRTPLSAALYAVSLAGALIGFGPVGIACLIALTRIIGAVLFAVACRHALRLHPAEAAKKGAWRPLLRFGSWVSVTSVLMPLTGYLDRFLVGAFVSVSAVAFYAAPYELASKLLFVPGSISAVLLPSLSQAFRLGDDEAARTQSSNSFLWSSCALFSCAVLLMTLAGPLLTLWLGADYAGNSTTAFRFLLLAVYLNGLTMLPFTFIESAGRPDLIAKYHLIELPIYLAFTIPLIRLSGIEGAALAWAVRNLGGFAVLLRLAAGARGTTIVDMIGRGPFVLAIAGAAVLAGALLALQLGASEWLVLLVCAAVMLSAVRWQRGFAPAAATNSPAV